MKSNTPDDSKDRDDGHGSRFDWTGARPILNPNLMLGAPKKILRRTLTYIYDIAEREAKAEREAPTREAYDRLQLEKRPHQVFLLDGARGSGKTTLLLTIRRYLELLGDAEKWTVSTDDPLYRAVEFLQDTAKEIRDEINELIQKDEKKGGGGEYRSGHFKEQIVVRESKRKVALALPVLYPSDLEFSQTIMEGIIALMSERLERDLRETAQKSGESASRRLERAKELKDVLSQQIAGGWFLSNNVGMDAVLRDSADYRHFLEERTEANRLSFARVTKWRDFVNQFLDHFDSELLAVFFDDTDLGISITRDILHTIRIFLDHPRIVTVIAGNLRSIRQSLLLDEMKSLRGAVRSLSREGDHTAGDWRRFARQQIEESLEKVLPRQFRMSIAPTSTRDAEEDFRRMFNGQSLDEYCGNRLSFYRNDFLTAKHEAHFRWLADRQEKYPGQGPDTHILENYTAWWVFRNSYREELRPRSARHMAAMRAFTFINRGSKSAADLAPSEHRKRLAVILFESPDNFEIIHRLNDYDVRIPDWLRRQDVASNWCRNRTVSMNGQAISELTYSYQAMFFRVDLDLALPIHENRGVTIHPGLLPTVGGNNLFSHRAFFERNGTQPLFGAADAFKHSVIPANCFYFSDLSCLPDVVWKDDDNRVDVWGHRQIYNWSDFFFFYTSDDRDRERIRSIVEDKKDAPGSAVPAVPEAWVKDYFVNIVIPMASVTMGRFVRPELEVHRSRSLDDIAKDSLLASELKESQCFAAELENAGKSKRFFEWRIGQIETIIRHFDYLESVATGSSGSQTIQKKADLLLDHWQNDFMGLAFPEVSMGAGASAQPGEAGGAGKLSEEEEREKEAREKDQKREKEAQKEEGELLVRQLGSYQWLANDVRRAWHAARIFISQTSDTLKKVSARRQDGEATGNKAEVTYKDTFSRSDRYVVGTRTAFDRWLKRSPTMKAFLERVEEKSRDLSTHAKRSDASSQEMLSRHFGVRLKGGFFEASEKDNALHVMEDLEAIVKDAEPGIVHRPIIKPASAGVMDHDHLRNILGHRVQARDGDKAFDHWPFGTLSLDPGMSIDSSYERPWLDALNKNTDAYKLGLQENKTISMVRANFRLSRAFLFFLYGVAPCLPSLIHIEIAAFMKAYYDAQVKTPGEGLADKEKGEHWAKDFALRMLEEWRTRTWSYLHFVKEYRRVLEFAKVRLDIMTLRREAMRQRLRPGGDLDKSHAADAVEQAALAHLSPSEHGVSMTMLPDVSYDLLGIQGLIGLHLTFGEGIEDAAAMNARLLSLRKSLENHSSRAKWNSIFEDVTNKLAETLNFIEATEKTLVANAGPVKS